MSEFKKYRRKKIAELRPYKEGEILFESVSVSEVDKKNGSPKLGDMIARNPENHNDQWLVAKEYFEDNFEPLEYKTIIKWIIKKYGILKNIIKNLIF